MQFLNRNLRIIKYFCCSSALHGNMVNGYVSHSVNNATFDHVCVQ